MRHSGTVVSLASLLALAGLGLLGAVSCGDDAAPAEAPIPLPGRDGSSFDASGCGNDDPNCGECADGCPSGPRGKGSCSAGRCVLACDQGWGDCNGIAGDGCETDLTSTVDACGACGRDCRTCGGSTCTGGFCDGQTLSTRPNDIELLAVSPTHVVYSDQEGVAQVDKTDGGIENVYSVPNTPGLLVDSSIYFIYPRAPEPTGAEGIYRTQAGFVGPQIAAFAGGENAEAIALDETGIYYAVEKSRGVSRIVRCKGCSVPTELAGNENSVRQNAITLDSTSVYFGAGDMVRSVEKIGEGLVTLAVGQAPRSLAVDDTYVYWINEAARFPDPGDPPSGSVARIKKTGGAVEVIVSGLEQPLFLTVSETHLYVTDRGKAPGAGVLFRVAKDGKQRVDLARGITSLGGLAIDATCAWFGGGPQIRKLTR